MQRSRQVIGLPFLGAPNVEQGDFALFDATKKCLALGIGVEVQRRTQATNTFKTGRHGGARSCRAGWFTPMIQRRQLMSG